MKEKKRESIINNSSKVMSVKRKKSLWLIPPEYLTGYSGLALKP